MPNSERNFILESDQKSAKHIAEEDVADSEVLLIQYVKYNSHLQREVELSLPEISMMEKGTKKQSVKICPTPFQNDDPINYQLENTGKISVALQPKYPLNSVVYPISEANSSTSFNLLMRFR